MPLGNVYHSQSSLLLENNFPLKSQEALTSNLVQINHPRHHAPMGTFPFFEPLSEPHSTNSLQINPTPPHSTASQALYNTPLPPRRIDARLPTLEWRMNPQQQHQIHQHQPSLHADWRVGIDKVVPDYASGAGGGCQEERSSFGHQQPSAAQLLQTPHEVKIFLFRISIPLIYKFFFQPINFLSLLHPSSSPPYPIFVSRIIKSSDQQASIFLQQKLKVADAEERVKIVDAICARGFEMMAHRYDNEFFSFSMLMICWKIRKLGGTKMSRGRINR